MKVLFINYEMPPIGGGGGRATWQIARRLVASGHVVRVLTSLFQGLVQDEIREGVHIHRIQVLRKKPDSCPPRELLSFMCRSIPAVRRLAETFQPDVACAFFVIPGGPAAWKLMRRRKVPYVLALRGSDIPRPQLARSQRLHFFTRPFIRRMLSDATAVTSVSDALRDAALQIEPTVQIDVIPNGVDTEFFRPPAAAESRDPKPELLFVGRLREFKGVQHIIKALPAVERELTGPVQLTIVGDGPYKKKLAALAEEQKVKGALSEVRFLGWVSQKELRGIYALASAILLPSLVEGHPNVLLEGMASGLPCVATDVPGTREIVTPETGLLVPPENPEAIGRAVVQLLGNADTWRAMSRAARARAEGFSWDRVADRYETVLARAAEVGTRS